MIIQSKYTKIFHSNGLTRQKYDELHNFAVLIQNHKNIVSQYVNDNLLHFLEYNKFQFIKEMRVTAWSLIHGQDNKYTTDEKEAVRANVIPILDYLKL